MTAPDPAQSAETVRVEIHEGYGWCHVTVPCEHGDFLRNQTQAVFSFQRAEDRLAWRIEISDGLLQASPEAVHAALGVAIREMGSHYFDGDR